jgi:4,5-DOPA dioxygenase extradiol
MSKGTIQRNHSLPILSLSLVFATIVIAATSIFHLFLRPRLYSTTAYMGSSVKAPTWFMAHGGPPSLFDVNSGPHQHWLRLASDIKQANPKGIVVVSAHWQAEEDDFPSTRLTTEASQSTSILINTNTSNPLIYDFYNFPKHYYETKFRSSNSKELQDVVSTHLKQQGYHVQGQDRGLDHGVWVPLRASGEQFDIPILQVSLPIPREPLSDGVAALRLGRALSGLRSSGYAIVGTGQPVHNLRDYMMARQGYSLQSSNYGKPFTAALTQALAKTGTGETGQDDDPVRWNDAKALYSRPEYRKCHPTSEHFLPVLVALGAAEDSEAGVEEFQLDEGPLMWNMYRFG